MWVFFGKVGLRVFSGKVGMWIFFSKVGCGYSRVRWDVGIIW